MVAQMSEHPNVLDIKEISRILPHRYPFLLVDKIIKLDLDNDYIIGLKCLTINEQFFNSKIENSDELFNRLLYFELNTRLPNSHLAKVDTMTMAHSLEARVPYLDHNLVEMAFSLPVCLKLRMMREKYIGSICVRLWVLTAMDDT